MTGGPLLSIVMPVYNEGEHVLGTLDALAQHLTIPYEVLLVYDDDDDSTPPAVRPHLPAHPEWRLVKNDVARGPSGALRRGFGVARGDRILVAMADHCDDFSQIPMLLALVPERASIASPSRYCAGGRQELNAPLKVGIPRTAGRLLQRFAGLGTCDPTNSYKLYDVRLLRTLRLTSTVSFSVTLEIVAKAHALGYRVAEIPTVWRERTVGKSNFKFYRSLLAYLPWFLLAILGGGLIPIPRRTLKRIIIRHSREAATSVIR